MNFEVINITLWLCEWTENLTNALKILFKWEISK
jgi:hypothetical protein